MKVTYDLTGGRFGSWYLYYCAECGVLLGNSNDSKRLEHPSKITKGIFRKTVTLLKCSNIGKVCEMPKHEIECKEL